MTQPPIETQVVVPFTGIEESSVYLEFLAEREEILRLKWIESEKAGRDIGFDHALLLWIMRHRAAWRCARRIEGTERPGNGGRPGGGDRTAG